MTDKHMILAQIEEACTDMYGCGIKNAAKPQVYRAVCGVVKDILQQKRSSFQDACNKDGAKQVYYFSVEFLVGRSLRNNLFNLKMEKLFKDALKDINIDLNDLYELEPDAGLGNGGLGRLAACYIDALTTQCMPATGFSICYEFGIFKQKIVDGWQVEFPDDWLGLGDVWLAPRRDKAYEVRFGGTIQDHFENGKYTPVHVDYQTVIAVPYDMIVSGYDSPAANTLVLWTAKSPQNLDMNAFSRGEYQKALESKNKAEVISKVLYPADDHIEGKILRLKQQYLLVSASIQSIIEDHLKKFGKLSNLSDKCAIHINDTHAAMSVAELMRQLVDEYGFEWEEAWEITCNTLAYTNHTVMSEALERWPEHLFKGELPRVHQIICEINRRLLIDLYKEYPGDDRKIEYMAVIANGEIRMANLCLAACYKVNGVSALHSEIVKKTLFNDYYNIYPQKFTNVTNGIAYRRWLAQANPRLTGLITDLIGDGFLNDITELTELTKYDSDASVLKKLAEIKLENKKDLARYIEKANGVIVDPNSIFDVQIKRLHEYKRQLLNVLNILYMYNQIKSGRGADLPPRTFIFAAKASPGYVMAKQIIRLIVSVSNMINADPQVRDKIKVIFLEDYNVSLAEIIIPASEISEQISVAGKEASGTGNMKLMINGAVTIGTLDGANVEILEQVGKENMFLFGLTADEVVKLWQTGYDPQKYYQNDPELKAVIDMLSSDIFGHSFEDIAKSLLFGKYGSADSYMCLADFRSYVEAQKFVSEVYKNPTLFNSMSLHNIANADIFSADRAVLQYCDDIWHVKRVKVDGRKARK